MKIELVTKNVSKPEESPFESQREFTAFLEEQEFNNFTIKNTTYVWLDDVFLVVDTFKEEVKYCALEPDFDEISEIIEHSYDVEELYPSDIKPFELVSINFKS